MPSLRWPKGDQDAPASRRAAMAPRTANYEHPYTQRIPKPPPIESEALRQRGMQPAYGDASLRPTTPPPMARRNPARFGLYLSLGCAVTLCSVGYFVLSANYSASHAEAESIRQSLRNSVPMAYDEETPAQYVRSLDITSVRLAEAETRASINGQIYRAGELINERHGLILLGPDENGESLLFRDADGQVHSYHILRD